MVIKSSSPGLGRFERVRAEAGAARGGAEGALAGGARQVEAAGPAHALVVVLEARHDALDPGIRQPNQPAGPVPLRREERWPGEGGAGPRRAPPRCHWKTPRITESSHSRARRRPAGRP